MATVDCISTPSGIAQSAGVARFFAQAHMQEAQRIALHTAASNALSMANWNLASDCGSLGQAITKAEAALAYLHKLKGLSTERQHLSTTEAVKNIKIN